jgi:hypothetical protein
MSALKVGPADDPLGPHWGGRLGGTIRGASPEKMCLTRTPNWVKNSGTFLTIFQVEQAANCLFQFWLASSTSDLEEWWWREHWLTPWIIIFK